MRIGFRLLLAGAIVLGLGSGAALAAYQGSRQSASGAATGATASVTAQSGAGQPAAPNGGAPLAQQRGGGPAIGVVASVQGQEFSLKSESSQTPVTVRLTSETVIRKQAAGTLSDIKPGERVTVRGEAKEDGSIEAAAMQLVTAEAGMATAPVQMLSRGQTAPGGTPPGGGRTQGGQGVVVGTVKEVAGTVVSVARSGGSGAEEAVVKVTVSDQTTIAKTVAGEVQDIVDGTAVIVTGLRASDGAITASSVQLLPAEAVGVPGRQQ